MNSSNSNPTKNEPIEILRDATERYLGDSVLLEPLEVLSTMLIPGEMVVLIEKAHMNGGSRGILALTDKRIFYVRRRTREIEATFFQYREVIDVTVETGFGLAEIWLQVKERQRPLKFGFGRSIELARSLVRQIESHRVNYVPNRFSPKNLQEWRTEPAD